MQYVRVHRGADAASNHHLVLIKLKLKLKSSVEKGGNRTRYNVERLKDKERMDTFRLLHDLLDEENIKSTHIGNVLRRHGLALVKTFWGRK